MASPTSLLTFGRRVGLLLIAGTSTVSACAIISLLSYIAYSAVSIIRGSSRRWSIGGPAEVYFLNQLAWDLVQAAGGIMNIKWATDASIRSGSFCSVQGTVKHMSSIGCALSTLAISLYTFRTLCFMKVPHHDGQLDEEKTRRKRLYCSLVVVVCIWASVALIVTINVAVNGVGHFYGPAGDWCWIRSEYSIQRTACDFAFMWTTAAANIVIYAILFLHFRGYITTSGRRIHTSRRPELVNIYGPFKQACGLLFYPLIYILTVLPLSIARYSAFAHYRVPVGVTILADAIYLSSGLLNVILFSRTRPFLFPHDPPTSDTMSETHYGTRLADASQCDTTDVGVSPQAHNFPRAELEDNIAENASIHSLGV